MPRTKKSEAAAVVPAEAPKEEYDKAYWDKFMPNRPYAREHGWLEFFQYIADRIILDINPQSVLDAGCAMGFLVEALRDRGVEAYGVDLSDYALAKVRPDIKQFTWKGSVSEPLPRRYDLIVSIEVLEHLPAGESDKALANLCRSTDDFLFSSTPADFKEPTHHNVRPPEYWAERFAQAGFYRDMDFDPTTFISPTAVRLRRVKDPLPLHVARYERIFWTLKQENLALREAIAEWRGDRMRREAAEQELSAIKHDRLYRAAVAARSKAIRALPASTMRGRLFRKYLKRSGGRGQGEASE